MAVKKRGVLHIVISAQSDSSYLRNTQLNSPTRRIFWSSSSHVSPSRRQLTSAVNLARNIGMIHHPQRIAPVYPSPNTELSTCCLELNGSVTLRSKLWITYILYPNDGSHILAQHVASNTCSYRNIVVLWTSFSCAVYIMIRCFGQRIILACSGSDWSS